MTEYDWSGFRALVARLDGLLLEKGDETKLAEDCRKSLAFLYAAGISMPTAGEVFDNAGEAEVWQGSIGEHTEGADAAVVEEQVVAISRRLRASVEALQPDVDEDEFDELLWLAAQNLYDLRAALIVGVAHFDAGRLKEAAWEWSFGFDDWGSHCLAALNALHELLWGAL